MHALPPQTAPRTKTERDRIHAAVEALPPENDTSRGRLEELARKIAPDEHLAWTMVLVGSRFWRDRVRAVPFHRRLLLLPHCMRSAGACPASYAPEGLLCENCGRCPLGGLKAEAEALGCHVMIAEGSPVVMQWILGGKADAILGLGCLRSLERAFDKLRLAGTPALAVPLHTSTCRDSETDLDRAREMIRTPYVPTAPDDSHSEFGPTWIHLLRGAARLFEQVPGETPSTGDPIDQAAELGLDFVRRGGKFYRPFITLAAYDARTGAKCTGPDGADRVQRLPDPVKRAAAAVEIFHKASLIHDDIEDDDAFRYGMPTLHRARGTAVAVNVGDYLLGRGYQLIGELHGRVPAEIVAEILARLSKAHVLLSRGQGAELAWKNRDLRALTPPEVLKIYVLKTSPAFEAALAIGVLSAPDGREFYRGVEDILARYSRHLGVAFQIRNDLDDWEPDGGNKRLVGTDLLAGRPTLLRALANMEPDGREPSTFEEYEKAGVFARARDLAGRHTAKAREAADRIEHEPLRRLLIDTALAAGLAPR